MILLLCACGGTKKEPEWPQAAKKWFDRASYSYAHGDLEDAELASDKALAALPNEAQVRLIAARVAMASLSFDRALELLRALPGSEAAAIRGRAHWYLGDLEKAAEELALLAQDPEVKDAWAEQTLKLARGGRGRIPFEMTGGLLAVVEMPRAGSAMLIPLELNGEPSLAMIATDRAESVIDSRVSEDGGWVSLRFGGRLEMSDVPAVAQDLSGISREIGAPIKLLIGVHLLRHLNATIDLAGRQFVVRNYESIAPPEATTVHPLYYRGGAMVLPGAFGAARSAPSSSLLVNTSMAFPLALDKEGWKKGGQDASTFVAVPGGGELRHGILPLLRLGAFEIPDVPGVYGAPVEAVEKEIGVDLDGFAGSGLFGTFRLTFADAGRTLWMEDLPLDVIEMRRQLALDAARSQAQPQANTSALTGQGSAGVPGSSQASPPTGSPTPSPQPASPAQPAKKSFP